MINIYKTKVMKEFLDPDFYNPCYDKHHLTGNHMLVCGGTGTGKTNFVSNVLIQMHDTFGKLIIVCKKKQEAVYKMFSSKLKDKCIIYDFKELPPLAELAKTLQGQQTMMIFDDFVNDKNQSRIEEYVIMARKDMIMCVFLTQSFFGTSKIIRQNVGYVVLLAMANKKNLDMICDTIASLEKPTIIKCIKNATKFKMNVCIIDLYNPDLNMKLRRNFDDFYTVVDDEGDEVEPNMFKTSGILN